MALEIILIAAIAKNKVIGNKGKIPWYIPEDLKHFKQLTLNHSVIMGRKTYDSLPNKFKPLPKRVNIVLTHKSFINKNLIVSDNLKSALDNANEYDEEVYIIGGESLYRQTIDIADKLEITEIHKEYKGDTFFPNIDPKAWHEKHREDYKGYSFVTYERIK